MTASSHSASPLNSPGKEPAEKIIEEVGTSRMREYRGPLRLIVFVLAVGLSCFHLYTAAFGAIFLVFQRCVHIGLVSVLVFFLFPFTRKGFQKRIALQ